MAELRTKYDTEKAENIKLNDSLETQHKLWKVWLLKMEDKEVSPPPVTERSTHIEPDKEDEPGEEDEPSEEEGNDEEVEIIDEKKDNSKEIEENDAIYQRFIQNKKRGFKRTSPTTNSVPNNVQHLKCKECGYNANDEGSLNDHITRTHKITRRSDAREQEGIKDNKGQKSILYCHFWNNFGSCKYEEKNGSPCKFAQKQAPRCNFDGKCTRKACMFSHKNQNTDFLGNSQRGFRPPPQQAQQPWQILMDVLGFPGMNAHGQSRGGKQRRY